MHSYTIFSINLLYNFIYKPPRMTLHTTSTFASGCELLAICVGCPSGSSWSAYKYGITHPEPIISKNTVYTLHLSAACFLRCKCIAPSNCLAVSRKTTQEALSILQTHFARPGTVLVPEDSTQKHQRNTQRPGLPGKCYAHGPTCSSAGLEGGFSLLIISASTSFLVRA